MPSSLSPACATARRATLLAAAGLLTACGHESRQTVVEPPACSVVPVPAVAPAIVPEASPWDAQFAAAGEEFGVPVPLLRAIGYLETRWQMVEGDEEFPGRPAAFGVMALRGDPLRDGARLAGVAEDAVRRDPLANIRAAAALLREDATALGVRGDDLDSWLPVAAEFSGIVLPAGREGYVVELAAILDGRRSLPATAGMARADANSCAPPTPVPPPVTDEAGAVWHGSPNFNQRMAGVGGTVHMIIIHSCEGAFSGCWSWLADPASQVSAHYVVREDGAEIVQLVRESARAWHIAATYDSTLNAGHGGELQGIQSNHFTIGIEHAGYARQTEWPAAQIEASARLVCDISKRWNIPRDQLHVVSHARLQPYNRTDPGAGWPWAEYLARIDALCQA